MKKTFKILAVVYIVFGFSVAGAESKICTTEYKPVCAKLQVQCIKAPCEPIYQTFSNRCEAEKRKEHISLEIVSEGECEDFGEKVPPKNYNPKNDSFKFCAHFFF